MDVAEHDLARLDAFEGEMYQRQAIKVTTPEGETHAAFLYVFRDDYVHLLEEDDWDEQWFERQGIMYFASEYRGFDI